MSFVTNIFKKPIDWLQNTLAKRVVGSVLRKLIAGVGVGLITLGTLAGVPEEGRKLAEGIAQNQDVIFEYASGVVLFLGATIWGVLEKFKNK